MASLDVGFDLLLTCGVGSIYIFWRTGIVTISLRGLVGGVAALFSR